MSKNEVRVKPLDPFKNNLEGMLSNNVDAIPKGVNADRLKINALMTITQNKDLMKHAVNQPAQIAQFVFNFVVMGLDMLDNQCYIVPYGGKLTPVIDYRGEKKLAMQYSVKPIKQILSGVVKSNDKQLWSDDGFFKHEFSPFATEKERGEVVGAYCSVRYKDGTREDTFVNLEEIEKVKSVSPSSNSNFSPWVKWFESMVEKTVIKKAMKNIFLDFGNTEIQQAYIDSNKDVDFNSRDTVQKTVDQNDVFDMEFDEETEDVDEETGEVIVELD